MPSVPTRKNSGMPEVFKGEIYHNVGRYARGAIMFAFEENGGAEGLAKWAKENQDDFYIKLFPKIVTRESEVHHVKSLDDLMDVIDGDWTEAEHTIMDESPLTPDPEPYVHYGSAIDTEEGWDVDDYVDFPDE